MSGSATCHTSSSPMIGDEYIDTRDRRVWTLLIDRAVHGGERSVCLQETGPPIHNKWVPLTEFLEHFRKV